MGVLDVENLCKTYRPGWGRGPVRALRGVSLTVEAGEILGLLGPNGAGKTTLIKCALDLVRPDAGRLRLLGLPASARRARAQVGYLPEEQAWPGYLNAAQLLRVVGRLFGLRGAVLAERVARLLDQVGLAARPHTKIKAYSKGMRQRLGLAQALVNAPKLLILDEPNEGLDPIGRSEVKALLLALKAQGVSVLISSHVLAELQPLCDRVAILHEGRLLAEGTMASLTRDKTLEQTFLDLIHAAEAKGVP